MWLTQSDARYPCGHVVTSSVSLISVQARKIAHFTAPPFPKKSGDFSGTLCDRAAFLCSRLLPYLPLPAEKKILCLPPPFWIRFLSFDFGHTKKPPHDITNGRGIPLLSNIAMLCNGFEIQNLCCILPAERSSVISAAVSPLPSADF